VTRRDVNVGEGSRSRTSVSLIKAAKADDPCAWRQLVERYGPLVYHWCRRAGLQPADASDVVQEVLRSVASGLGAFRHQGKQSTFRGWLRRITQRRIVDLRRKATRLVGTPAGGHEGAAWLQGLPTKPDRLSTVHPGRSKRRAGIDQEVLGRVRASFSERNWRIFWRVVVDLQDTNQVAEEFGVTPNVVRLVKSRVLKRLREELSSEAGS
jgi:RNA polymerase sigma-70 factor (ECF subfamily)